MRKITVSFSLCLLVFGSGVASAASTAEVITALKKTNTDMCVEIGINVPDAPRNAKLMAPYCACVTDVYWQSVPSSDQQELASKGFSPNVQKNWATRLESAQGACTKKIGF